MKNYLLPILFIFALGCQEKSTKEASTEIITEVSTDYRLEMEDGIYVEVFDPNYLDENRYTLDNQVFKEGSEFFYAFYHLTPKGKKLSFKHDDNIEDYTKAWQFLDFNSTDKKKIDRVKISVIPGLHPFIESIPDYNQSIVKFDYLIGIIAAEKASFNSMSGVIENENNIWLHPPRDKYFRILELNPFPFVQAPYEVGNTWTWELTIGSSWGDERWKTWEGNIKNSYQYEITDKRMISSEFGTIECFEISATATSRIGSTQLISIFSPKYGFISLDYTNIDGSKTVLELRNDARLPSAAH